MRCCNRVKISVTLVPCNSKITQKISPPKSSYLLQNAHNPVNWFPWSEEAFEIAKRDNKTVFLYIGYSYLLTHTYLSLKRCLCD
ncbi:DUF255 domain-containing protein [Paenibacillus sp. GCM10012306]|uniref:DUF255 domain-containing protein n=1 Tax=Paenibacillus sp. GCM10012306 TaxID=3317342 RepID=UPI00360F49B3